MKIEEMEEELNLFSCMTTDCEEADFGRKVIPKLIAVAKAAKECIARCQCCSDLIDAVDILEMDNAE